MPKLETKPRNFFKPDPNGLARHVDPEETRRRGEEMLARGQLQPVAALEDGRMIFGHGRLLSAKSAGMKTLEAKIYQAMSDTQSMLTRALENLQRKELTAYRRWRLCVDLIRGIKDTSGSLEFRLRSGNSMWFPYAWLGPWRYNPSEGLLLKSQAMWSTWC